MKTKILAVIFILSSLNGCSALAPKTTSEIANYFDAYCLTMSEEQRQLIRDDFNAQTRLATVEVTCD